MMKDSINEAQVYSVLSKLIQFPSVQDLSEVSFPFGKATVDALEYMLELGKKEGFHTCNLDNKVGYIEYGQGEDYVAVLTHLDVVPAGNYWTVPPFGGTIEEDRIVGRGALDDKGPAVASFFALKAIKDSGQVLDKKVRLIFGLNEETGSKCIEHYLTKEKPAVIGFTPDADFPVIYAEKGITSFKLSGAFTPVADPKGVKVLSVKGGTAVNMVPDLREVTMYLSNEVSLTERVKAFESKYPVTIDTFRENENVICILKGCSAHASTPEVGKNAVSYMMAFLKTLPLQAGGIQAFINDYASLIGLDYNGRALGMGLEDETSGKLTLNVGVFNLTPSGFNLHVNVRYPVTHTPETVYNETFKETLKQVSWQLEEGRCVAPIVHDIEGPLVKGLMSVYKKHTGDEQAKPICIGGGTYARSMPNIVAFGPLFPHTHDTMHQADEYMTKSDLLKLIDIYEDAILTLANSSEESTS